MGGFDGLGLWDVATGRAVGRALTDEEATNPAFSPDGKTLAAGTQSGTIRLWDATSRRPLSPLRGHTFGVSDIAFSPDGRMLASAGGDGALRLWDMRTHDQLGAPLRTSG